MRLLLDTHTLLWFCEGNAALSNKARAAIEDRSNEIYVSHATAWELAVKMSLGKLKLQVSYEDLFPGVLLANGFMLLQPDFRQFRTLLDLPFHHRDPFDRLLIAQAKAGKLTLVTCDHEIDAYDVPVFW